MPPPLGLFRRLCSRLRLGQLGPPQLLLDAALVGRHPVGHRLTIGRPIHRTRAQAAPAQRHQLSVRPAVVQPRKGLRQVGRPGTSDHVPRRHAADRRLPSQDSAQDAAQCEHVGAGVGRLPRACSGAMYAGVPSTVPAWVRSEVASPAAR